MCGCGCGCGSAGALVTVVRGVYRYFFNITDKLYKKYYWWTITNEASSVWTEAISYPCMDYHFYVVLVAIFILYIGGVLLSQLAVSHHVALHCTVLHCTIC